MMSEQKEEKIQGGKGEKGEKEKKSAFLGSNKQLSKGEVL